MITIGSNGYTICLTKTKFISGVWEEYEIHIQQRGMYAIESNTFKRFASIINLR